MTQRKDRSLSAFRSSAWKKILEDPTFALRRLHKAAERATLYERSVNGARRALVRRRMSLALGSGSSACGWAALLAALAIGLLSGCGAVRPIRYFQLTVPQDAPQPESADALPVTLLVGSLLTSHLYGEDRIVYSNGREQLGTYEYQRWANPPTEMIEELLLRRLRASGRYHAVYYQRSNTQGDFALHGRLYDFSELTGSRFSARVTFEIELRDLRTGGTVWCHDYTHDEPVTGKDVRDVVMALDRNVQRGVGEVQVGLERYFTSQRAR